MKQKTILLELLRWLCAGLAVVFLVVSFRQEPVSSAAFEDVASAVTASIDLSALQEGSVQMVKRLYGLNPSDFDGCLLYYLLTNHSILDIRGNYVLFVVHKDAAAVQQAFRGAL